MKRSPGSSSDASSFSSPSRSTSGDRHHKRHESHKEERKRKKESKKKHKKRNFYEEQERRIQEAEEAARMLAAASSVMQVNPQGATASASTREEERLVGQSIRALKAVPKFDWVKKRKAEEKMGLSRVERERRDADRRREAEEEIKKLQRSREEREQEYQLMQEERERIQREKEAAAMGDWYRKEELFHLEQSKMRAAIRLVQGRPMPIDVVVAQVELGDEEQEERYAKALDDWDREQKQWSGSFGCLAKEDVRRYMGSILKQKPSQLMQELSGSELKEVLQEIHYFIEHEPHSAKLEHWSLFQCLVKDALEKQMSLRERPYLAEDYSSTEVQRLTSLAFGRDRIMAASVLLDIHELLLGKTFEQLVALKKSVESKLTAGGPLDVDYWELLLRVLDLIQSRKKLDESHDHLFSQWKKNFGFSEQEDFKLRRHPYQRHPQSHPHSYPQSSSASSKPQHTSPSETQHQARQETSKESLSGDDPGAESSPETQRTLQQPAFGSKQSQFEQQIAVMQDQGLIFADTDTWDDSHEAERLFKLEASREMESDEEVMTQTAVVDEVSQQLNPNQQPNRPRRPYGLSKLRKPRYYNRIQTGYEWTKYNRTHYDTDNPPPKVVQGYKFNIFYPGLYDKRKVPVYTIHDDPEASAEKETVLLQFSAGAPYEDIAFRIVNQPWDYLPRHGFRSSFDRGTLQLYFRFRRLHYRR